MTQTRLSRAACLGGYTLAFILALSLIAQAAVCARKEEKAQTPVEKCGGGVD